MDIFWKKYKKEAIPFLKKELGLDNDLAVPKVEKVVVNMGVAVDSDNKEALEQAKESLFLITGQKPKVNQAKKSISGFSLRKGAPVVIKRSLGCIKEMVKNVIAVGE